MACPAIIEHQRVSLLVPTWFYPTIGKDWILWGNAVRGYPPMTATVVMVGRTAGRLLVRANWCLPRESSRRFAWISSEFVKPIPLSPEE